MNEAVQKLLTEYRKYPIPTAVEIAEDLIKKRISDMSSDEIKAKFDVLVEKLQVEVYREYLRQERKIGRRIIKSHFSKIIKQNKIENPHDLLKVVTQHFEAFDKMFLSLSQSRRARAGKTFEYIIICLFKKLDYPFSYRPIINGEPDFLLPSGNHFKKFSADCIIFTAKRTLRERWRQIVTEGTRGLGFYLATIDDGVSANQLDEMKRNRVFLVVPKRLKETIYAKRLNVISFVGFFESYVDPAMVRWKKAKII